MLETLLKLFGRNNAPENYRASAFNRYCSLYGISSSQINKKLDPHLLGKEPTFPHALEKYPELYSTIVHHIDSSACARKDFDKNKNREYIIQLAIKAYFSLLKDKQNREIV